MDIVIQQLINGLVVGSIYALFALGFTLVFGVLKIVNLAHGAIFMAGTFAGLYSITLLDFSLPLAFVAAIIVAGLLSVILDFFAFRPLRKRGGSDFAAMISSIGAGLILMSLAQQISNTKIMRFPFGTFPIILYEFLGLRISLLQILNIVSVMLIVSGLLLFLYRTDFGLQIRAVAISEQTSKLLGVNPTAVYMQTFFLSGALAGVAGVLIGLTFNSVHFLMGEPYLLRAFVVVVLGGLGSVGGAVIAGLLLGMIQTLSIAFLSSALSDAILFGLLFVVLLLRPKGFFGNFSTEGRVVRQ